MSEKLLTRRQFLKRCAFGGAGLLLASYPVFIERYLIQINTYRIPVPNLPAAFDGFTILQLTDLHYGTLVPLSLVRWVVNKANNRQKDIIVCTGDYIHEDNSSGQIDEVWPVLAELHAPHGVYSVLGNHDHWADFERSMEWMDRTGQNLRNKVVPFKREDACIWLGGVGDLWEDQIEIDTTFASVPPQDCKIVLAHNPDTADREFQTRIDLIISGHTHGGQVNIPFIGAPILPVNNKRYTSGYFRTENTRLYISRGIGWAGLPVRFNCPPEISILQLTPEA